MTNVPLTHLLRRLHQRTGPDAATDAQLLLRFTAAADEAAFAELVRRHGPMVRGVCRRLLAHEQDAEDAFQATFLVLARKAAAVRRPESLPGWLYGVACRTALRAKVHRARRPCPDRLYLATTADPADELTWGEVRGVLDEELGRLPEKYRAPLVLCYLEGRTQDEAARQLGWGKDVLRGRLDRGRERLRRRLTQRGVALSAGLFAATLTPTAVSAALVETTARAATTFAAGGTASTAAVVLAQGGLRAMTLGKLQTATVFLTAMVCAVSAGGLAYQTFGQTAPVAAVSYTPQADEPPKAEAKSVVRLDVQGDALPDEALSRLGTTRLRHGGWVGFVCFTPDGKVLSQGADGVRLWDMTTGKQVHHIPKDEAGGSSGNAALSPDGTQLATANESGLHLWDSGTLRHVRTLSNEKYFVVRFGPDGKTVVAMRSDKQRLVEVVETATGRQLWSWESERNPMRCLDYAPDGKSVVVAGWAFLSRPPQTDNTVFVLDATTGKEQRRIELGENSPFWTVVSPDSKLLGIVCYSADGRHRRILRVFDLATGKEQFRLDPPASEGAVPGFYFYGTAFTADGKHLVSTGGMSALVVWDLATGKEVRRVGSGLNNGMCLALSRDNQTAAVSGFDAIVRLVRMSDGTDLFPTAGRLNYASQAVFGPDDKSVVTVGAGPSCVFWDPATGRERRRVEVKQEGADASILSDGRTVKTSRHGEKSFQLWDLETGKKGPQYSWAFGDPMTYLYAHSPEGRVGVLSSVRSDTLRLTDLENGKVLHTFQAPGHMISSCHFAQDGQTLFAYYHDHTVCVWDVQKGTKLHAFGPMGDPRSFGPLTVDGYGANYATAESPDGKIVAYGDQKDCLRLFDVASGQLLYELSGLPSGAGVFAFSPDGRTLAWCGWRDAEVHLLEVATGKERRSLLGHRGNATSLAFSRDGKSLVTSSSDRTALVWDLTGRLAAGVAWGKPLSAAALEAAWTALPGDDAAKAYQAIRKLTASPAQTVPFLTARLQPATAEERQPAGETLRAVRAVEVLEHAATPEARRLLERLAQGAAVARLTREAKDAQARLR